MSSLFFILLVSLTHCLCHSTDQTQTQTYIIHTSKPPPDFLSHHHWHSSLLLSLSSPPPPLLYSYSLSLSGFSASLSPAQSSLLRLAPGVLSVRPDNLRHLHTTRSPSFLGLSDSSGLWPNSRYADDVVIGVLDTGIWPHHPSFSDAGLSPPDWRGACHLSPDFNSTSCNRKLVGAKAFYRGYESALGKPMDETVESKSPRDTEGHGTHTASTAAGSAVSDAGFYEFARGEARGMAGKARIAAYKICWKVGCFDSDILAAMDEAISDGVHVISLSVGASGPAPRYDDDSIAIGAFGAARHGVVVSCSAGNSGPDPYTAVNVAPWILTVGASTIDREFPADVVLGDGRVFGGVSLYSGGDSTGGSELLPLAYADDCGSRLCYPGKLDPSRVAGKIVVCDRGGNARVEKGSAVKVAGGVGMVLANTAESGEELVADSHLVPATMVGQAAAAQIRAYARSSDPSPTATIVFKGTAIGRSPAAPMVAAFSSRGPNRLSPEILKPDVIAPGVNILAGWTGASAPTDLDIDPRRVEFNIISGTSMSCPHVSGLAGLLRKAYPSWSPAAIKSALMTTAYNLDNNGNNITDLATGDKSTPFVHGAGHVDPNKALDPGLVYDIDSTDYVAFLCAIGYDPKRIAVFVTDPATVDCASRSLASAGDLNLPSFSVVFDGDRKTVRYKRVVKNVGNLKNAVYEVKVRSPPSVEISVSPSKLVFGEDTEKLTYEITFTNTVAVGKLSVASQGFGSVEWSDGTHVVRSPVAVMWRQESPVSM